MKFALSKTLLVLLLVLCTLVAAACNGESTPTTDKEPAETVAVIEEFEDIFPEENLYQPIWDGAFSYDDYEIDGVKAVGNFKYYVHEKGTSSVNTRIVIYRLGKRLICSYSCFECGNGYMETIPLSREQGELFLELVKNYKETERPDFGKVVGGYEYEFMLKFGNSEKYVEGFDLSPLGLEIPDEFAVDYEDYEQANEILNIPHMLNERFNDYDSTYISHMPVNVSTAIYVQLEKYLRIDYEEIYSFSVTEENENTVEFEVVTEDDKSFSIIATYGGCILEIKE